MCAVLRSHLCILLFVANSSFAYGECKAFPPPREALKASEAVFVGRALKVQEGKTENRFEFEVHYAWKGVNAPKVFVSSSAMIGCGGGTTFSQGHLYLVYAINHNGSLWTGSCSRTTSLDWAGEDLAALDRPATAFNIEPEPGPKEDGDVDSPAAPLGFLVFLVMTFAIGVGVGWLFAHRYPNSRPIFAEVNHE